MNFNSISKVLTLKTFLGILWKEEPKNEELGLRFLNETTRHFGWEEWEMIGLPMKRGLYIENANKELE